MECKTDFEIDMNKKKGTSSKTALAHYKKVECFASFMLLIDTLYSRNQNNLSSVIFFAFSFFSIDELPLPLSTTT